ncbi:MAG TPA: hypothetical protein ACFYD6_03635 [Candidatus Brocadiia bacterium]|nr:hypothetical protein [Candidatus Brocadiales bacterium]
MFRYVSIYILFSAFCWLSSALAVTYDPIEPVTLLKSASEHAGKFVTFQAKFLDTSPKTKELLSALTGARVDLNNYDSFVVYGNGFVFPRMLISKQKGSDILYKLKSDTTVAIYGEVYRVNMVGEPIIIVHKIEKTGALP